MKGRQEPYLSQVIDDWFDGHAVSAEKAFSGQGLNEGGGFKLGCRAGPFVCVTNLLHEMGHLVEIEEDRLLKMPGIGWGLYHGKTHFINGRAYTQMNTERAVMREIISD
jgi:hypothetical protein